MGRSSRILGAAAVAFLMLGGRAMAQQIDPSEYDPQNWFKQGCPTCGVHGYVDFPSSGVTLMRNGIMFAGWGFECVTGKPIDRIDVSYEVADGAGGWQPLKQADWALHFGAIERPDVVNAFANVCPSVPVKSGWWLQITNPPPPGARRVMLKLYSGIWHANLIRTYQFIDPKS